ncbi:2'-5' RNA ligase family protein [Flavihumibacter stibioxidans]|uniref:2'-5' RNA ligase n=1 Tax=Flavihumibacter stibioxidans TaxID=1834163 RepID=A0ABR7MDD4_9BACT|nr:2'-5' RNA ligase family protein [Flavihumibacter stibioxidans]MBC6492971.1 hypothetical protein [Flavihumibacter stibioxidans]
MGYYFIGLVAPAAIDQQFREWKKWMLDGFGCKVAMKSPAHITLIPPFQMKESEEGGMRTFMDRFAETQFPFDIRLDGFGSFDKRVIFVKVDQNQFLGRLYDRFQHDFLLAYPGQVKPDKRPFHPHMTIATRDIPRQSFGEAMEHFTPISFSAVIPASELSLLYLRPGRWDVVHRAVFGA